MTHPCPVTPCPTRVAYNKVMCPRHWKLVPPAIQNAVYRAWNHGQGAGSYAHTAAIMRAIEAARRAR